MHVPIKLSPCTSNEYATVYCHDNPKSCKRNNFFFTRIYYSTCARFFSQCQRFIAVGRKKKKRFDLYQQKNLKLGIMINFDRKRSHGILKKMNEITTLSRGSYYNLVFAIVVVGRVTTLLYT